MEKKLFLRFIKIENVFGFYKTFRTSTKLNYTDNKSSIYSLYYYLNQDLIILLLF